MSTTNKKTTRGDVWRLVFAFTLMCFYPIYYASSAVIFPFAPVIQSGLTEKAEKEQRTRDILPKFATSPHNAKLNCNRISDPRLGRASPTIDMGLGTITCDSVMYQGFVVSRNGQIFVEPLYELSPRGKPKVVMQNYAELNGSYFVLISIFNPGMDNTGTQCPVIYRLAVVTPKESKVDSREIQACVPIATMSVTPPVGKAKSTIVSIGVLDKTSLIKAWAYNVDTGKWLD